MRKILIDEQLHNEAILLYEHFHNRLQKKPIDKLEALKAGLDTKSCLGKLEFEYVVAIIERYQEISLAKPEKLKELIDDFNLILDKNQVTKMFHKSITDALRYRELRKIISPIYRQLNLKACVYCNAQLTVVVDGEKGEAGRFELDHFYPQSKYPFLATSFYNLIPCCGNCNKSKKEDESFFHLYTEETSLDTFRFVFTDDSKDKYLLSRDVNDLEVEFATIGENNDLVDNHDRLFRINDLYKTQRDILEDLAMLSQIYNDDAKQDLIDNYIGLFPDRGLINRMIIGNYDRSEDIHKRPLSKYTQDLARELKIIK